MIEKDRRKPNLKNRVDESLEKEVVKYAIEFPAYGQQRASNELRKKGTFIPASGGEAFGYATD